MATKLPNWFNIYFTCFTIPLWTAVCDVLMLFWLVDCHVEKGSLLCHVDKYLKLKRVSLVCLRQQKYKKTIPWIVLMTYPLGSLVKMKTRETTFFAGVGDVARSDSIERFLYTNFYDKV